MIDDTLTFDTFLECMERSPEKGEFHALFEGNRLCLQWCDQRGKVLCQFRSEPLSPEQVMEQGQLLVKLVRSLRTAGQQDA